MLAEFTFRVRMCVVFDGRLVGRVQLPLPACGSRYYRTRDESKCCQYSAAFVYTQQTLFRSESIPPSRSPVGICRCKKKNIASRSSIVYGVVKGIFGLGAQPLHENLRVVGKPATLSARRYDQSGPHVCLLQYNLVKTESCQTSSSRCCHTTTSTVEYARIT